LIFDHADRKRFHAIAGDSFTIQLAIRIVREGDAFMSDNRDVISRGARAGFD